MKQKNLKKQFEHVLKLENELLENEFSHEELEEIKYKVLKKVNPSTTHRTDGTAGFSRLTKQTVTVK